MRNEPPILSAIRAAARLYWYPLAYAGSDPDAFLRAYGVTALRALVALAPRYSAPAVVEPAAGARPRRARIQRREVQRLSPAEQDRRMAAMLANLDALADARELQPCAVERDRIDGMAALDARAARRQEAAERARVETALAAHRGAYATGEDPLAQASRYLAAVLGGVSGQGRSKAAFDIAVTMCRGFALDERTALDLLDREYSPRCSPRWSRELMRGIVRRAARANRCGLGFKLRGGRAA